MNPTRCPSTVLRSDAKQLPWPSATGRICAAVSLNVFVIGAARCGFATTIARRTRPANRALASIGHRVPGPPMRHAVHIAQTADGVRLAWTRGGRGPVLVKTANWLTHL